MDSLNLETLSTEQQYIWQSRSKFKKAKTSKERNFLNHIEGNFVKTSTLTSIFVELTQKETETKTWRHI